MTEPLRLVIRTPHQSVVDTRVRSARVPTRTGQAGLRPGQEPLLLVVEPGLVLLSGGAGERYAATAGGLLEADREQAVLYTPFAVLGSTDAEVLASLEDVLATPDSEMLARRRLGELEQRIVEELRPHPAKEADRVT